MPRETTEAIFRCPPERIWRVLTDPVEWVWPGGPAWVRAPMDGYEIITGDRDDTETVFRVTAFAPPRWYALELENERTVGRVEALLFREEGGTRLEITADLEGRTARQKLLLRLGLRRWQRQYIESLQKSVGDWR